MSAFVGLAKVLCTTPHCWRQRLVDGASQRLYTPRHRAPNATASHLPCHAPLWRLRKDKGGKLHQVVRDSALAL